MKPFIAAALASLVLAAGASLSGCQNFSSADLELPSLTRHASENNSQSSFLALTNQLFYENAASSLLDRHYLLAHPEKLGLNEPESLYGSLSLEDLVQSTASFSSYLDQLEAINPINLDQQSQLDYQILKTYLKTQLSCQGMEGYVQPLSPTIGLQAQLPVLLAEYAFYTEDDVEDYFSLLAGLPDYFQQLLDLEQEKAAMGLMMSDHSLKRVLESCQPYLSSGEDCILTETFSKRLESLEGLSPEKKKSLDLRHQQLINTAFIPAYTALAEGLTKLMGTGKTEGGLCNYPEGKAYYRYLVYSSTFTSCQSIDTLRKVIENRIWQDFQEAAAILQKDPGLLKQIDQASFSLTDPEEILAFLREETAQSFPQPICPDYTICYVPDALESVLSPAFYLTPPLDQAGTNTIYINQGSASSSPEQLFSTLAHEGYPGHLYQTNYFLASDPGPFRHLLSFGAYTEGWATYVEMESYQMDPGLNPQLGRLLALNSSITLGLHAYLDIMVNDQGWNVSDIHQYLSQYYADPDQSYAAALYDAMVDNPANYLEYYVGYLEITDMRQKAENALGKKFQLMDFHRFLLDVGPAPFTVIREALEQWINERLSRP